MAVLRTPESPDAHNAIPTMFSMTFNFVCTHAYIMV